MDFVRILACCFALLAVAAAQETTEIIMETVPEELTTTPSATPSSTSSPSTPTSTVQPTQGAATEDLSRTDKIIIGVTCGVVGAAAIGGITIALINRKKARIQMEAEEDRKKLQENNA